jgi:hypothetical protein
MFVVLNIRLGVRNTWHLAADIEKTRMMDEIQQNDSD